MKVKARCKKRNLQEDEEYFGVEITRHERRRESQRSVCVTALGS